MTGKRIRSPESKARQVRYIQNRIKTDPEFKKQRYINHQNHRRRLREEVISKYGGLCACCGETEIKFLCIDHVNGGGNEERRNTKASSFYYRLKRDPVSPDYQVLCHNCNFAKTAYGKCPHKL